MSKNKVNEGLVDKAVSAIFGAVGRQLRKAALKDLAKKDPKIAKSINDLEKIQKDLTSVLTKKEKELASKGKYFEPDAFG